LAEVFCWNANDDLNFTAALAPLFEMAKELRHERNILTHEGRTDIASDELLKTWQTLITLANVLGLTAKPETETPAQDGLSDMEIEELIQKRQAARKAKNFAESDRIRDQLFTKGITLIDSKEGTRWHKG
jgi:cysteinyl-tRNA synthetase